MSLQLPSNYNYKNSDTASERLAMLSIDQFQAVNQCGTNKKYTKWVHCMTYAANWI